MCPSLDKSYMFAIRMLEEFYLFNMERNLCLRVKKKKNYLLPPSPVEDTGGAYMKDTKIIQKLQALCVTKKKKENESYFNKNPETELLITHSE